MPATRVVAALVDAVIARGGADLDYSAIGSSQHTAERTNGAGGHARAQ
jgi:hypothetical protein